MTREGFYIAALVLTLVGSVLMLYGVWSTERADENRKGGRR